MLSPRRLARLCALVPPPMRPPQPARRFSELLSRMDAAGDRLALADVRGRWSYAALAAGGRAVARGAGLHDLAPGARVALLCPRDHTYVVAAAAAWAAGAVAQPLPDAAPAADLEYYVRDAAPAVLLAARALAAPARALADATGVRLVWVDALDEAPPGVVQAAAAAAAPAAAARAAPEDGEAGALLIYTSGTTSKPKGVLTSRRALRAQISALVSAWEWRATDRVLHVLPLHHVHGVMAVLLCALWSGAAVEMQPRFSAPAAYAALARPRGASDALTLLMAVPTVYAKLLAHHVAQAPAARAAWEAAVRADGGLRLMVSGSAALPAPLARAWRKATGATLLERFGMTEFGLALSNPYRQGPRVDSSVGMPLPGYEAALADEAGGRLPAPPAGTAGVSASGELLIRGPGLFSSYWGKPAATAEVFTPDGWFRTGDSAHVDGRGYYYIDGRLSADIIKSGGYKISALEIERVMLEHAGVAEVAVFGMPHDVYGEAVVALVVPQGDVAAALPPVPAAAAGGLALHRGPAAAAAAATLRAWAKGAMAAYKVPSDIAFVAELPRNAMGKINKKELRAAYAAAVAAAAVSPPSHHR